MSKSSRYHSLIEKIFFDRYEEGATEIHFERNDLVEAAKALSMALPKNLGDVVYSVRYRTPMPERILSTQPKNYEWTIEGVGRALYAFKLAKLSRIKPNQDLIAIKIPDATPEIINYYALSDEQALLAKVRYNRLLDIFLGIAAYSLQNHLRTTVSGIGQIEIDEVYAGVDRHGRQFVMPVQAKGGTDHLNAVQIKQDIACCGEKFPALICRAIATQFMDDDLIAIFELAFHDDELKIVDEKHYCLVPGRDIRAKDLELYSKVVS